MAPALAAQQREVTGRVTAAETDEPLPGAEIYIEGTRLGTLADEEGNFRIQVPQGEVTLRANYLGYKSESQLVGGDEATVTLVLQQDVLQLEGVVTTGLAATVQRRNAANAVAVISDSLIGRVPTQSVESSLQGKVPGALIQQNSGAPGGGIQVNLRGVSSINADAEPLYVVDGVLVSNASVQSGADAITNATGGGAGDPQDNPVNRIADLDPRDVERIEILKGASAGAIYGSKAANGVVLITTKRGRGEGRPQVSATARLGTFQVSNDIGSRSFETLEEAVDAFGESAAEAYTGRTFDYEDELFGESDASYEASANVSGGGNQTRYYASALLKDDQGTLDGTGYEKQTLRMNLDQRVGSSLNLAITTNLIHSNARRGLTNNDNTGTSYYVVLPFTPNFVDLHPDANGVYPDNPFERSNPLQTRDLSDVGEDVFRFLGSVRGTYDLIASDRHSLQLIGDVGVDRFNQENELLFPPELEFEPQDGLPGTSVLTNGDNTNLNASGNLAYTFSPGPNSYASTTTGGVQYFETDLNRTSIVTRNLVGGQGNVDQGSSVDVAEDRQRIEEFGIYAQEELLLLDDRMLLTAGLRGDRSSSNGDDEKYYLFPKAAASYRFREPAPWLEEFKLRAAFGQTGNRPLFGQKFTPLDQANIEGLTGIGVDENITAGDPDVAPERQSEVETGFDAVLFDERASLEFSVYQRTITDLLLERTLAPSTGFNTQIFNGGELRNRGVEVGLGFTPVLGENVNWFTRATFFANKAEITDLPVPTFETGGFGTALGSFRIEEGASATQIVGVNGLDEDPNSPTFGEVRVDKLGDANPDFQMSLLNDITFHGWNFYSLWDWKKGGDIINLTRLLFDFGQNTEDFEPADGGECPTGRPTVDSPGCQRVAGFQTFAGQYIESGSYLKLRELALSYDVAPNLRSGLFGQDVRYVRVGVSGRNLVTFTPYSGLDPEVSNFGNRAIDRNIDVGPYPPSRSFWLTVDVGF
ncbi:MAG: SusC/RagA family TonB-linked outer membrane protein [Gemmatimonadetes bacterium]|nr:SusC/RagA family TonB-linked outer membrane protein [Gemmatimonadota bacterium]